MKHEEARDLLTDRLIDELAPDDRARLETHLERCTECRAAARHWAAAWEALGALDAAPIDPAAHVRFGRLLERERSRSRRRIALKAAAALALLLGGGLVGRALAPEGASDGPARSVVDGPRFLLLLRGDEPDRTQPRERLVREYGAWAGRLAEAGSLVAADELEPGPGRWVAEEVPSDRASTAVSGFFLVAAPSYDSAVAIARASPHAAYGGLIEVRRIADAP